MPSYSHHRPRAATAMRLRAADPRTAASRKAGCEAHKSGFVRGAPAQAGGPYSTGAELRAPARGHPIKFATRSQVIEMIQEKLGTRS